MAETPSPVSRKTGSKSVISIVGIVIIAAVIIWFFYFFQSPTPTPSVAVPAATPATEAPGDPRSLDELSDEAKSVRESQGVENSFGVTEAPRSPAKETKKEQELALVPQVEEKPVPLSKPISVKKNIEISVGKVRAVTSKANLPGEISGAAVEVPVTVKNETSEDISTRDVVVDVFFGKDLLPGVPMISSENSIFPLKVKPGEKATATFTVVVPDGVSEKIRVSVNTGASLPIALFDGERPTKSEKK